MIKHEYNALINAKSYTISATERTRYAASTVDTVKLLNLECNTNPIDKTCLNINPRTRFANILTT